MWSFTTVQGTQEHTYTLEQILAKNDYTLLYFYPKDNTPWCTVEAQDFTRLQEAFSILNIQIVWVSRDSIQSHCNFIQKYALTPLYVTDPELELHTQFEAWWEKNNYWKIVQWVIRSTVLLDKSWSIHKHWKNVRAKWHAERVLKEVQEMLA